MSKTLKDATTMVRTHLKDLGPEYVFSPDLIVAKLDNAVRNVVAPKLHLGQTYSSNAVAISPDAGYKYTLTGVPNYQQIKHVRLVSLGRDVELKSYDFLRTLWHGAITPSQVKGDPFYCALYEGPDQVVTLWLYPWPRKVDALDLFTSQIPNKLSGDTDAIPFDDAGCAAAEYTAAAEIIALASPRQLVTLDLNPQSVQLYMDMAKSCIADSRLRHSNLKNVGHTSRARR